MLQNRFCTTVVLLVLCIAAGGSLAAQVASDSDLAAITERGRMLYAYDQAAWHASDAVQATHPPKESMGDYIAQKTPDGWQVAFGRLNEKGDAFLVSVMAVQGRQPEQFSVMQMETPQRDTGFYLTAAKGIQAALKEFQGANRKYNVAVLPATGEQVYVYLLPAPTDQDPAQLGADARFLVSAEGAIVERRRLHKSLIPHGQAPPGATLAGGTHTHVLTDSP